MKKLDIGSGDFEYDLFSAIDAVLSRFTDWDYDTVEHIANEMSIKAIEALEHEQNNL